MDSTLRHGQLFFHWQKENGGSLGDFQYVLLLIHDIEQWIIHEFQYFHNHFLIKAEC